VAEEDHIRLGRALAAFRDLLEAVEELAAFAEEHVPQLDDELAVMKALIAKELPATAPEVIEATLPAFSSLFKKIIEAPEAVDVSETESDDAPVDAVDAPKSRWDDLLALFSDPKEVPSYIVSWARARNRTPRVSLLNDALLTTAVAGFEVLVAKTVREFFRLRPQALRTDEFRYSLSDIEGFQSLDEFRDSCAERISESLLRGGLDDWMEWFQKRLKISIADVSPNPVELREVFQRRHLLVHNGGEVNRLYLIKMEGMADPPELGDRLIVDSHYLQAAIDKLSVAGVLLISRVMRSVVATQGDRHPADGLVQDQAFESLQNGRHHITIALVDATLDSCLSDYLKLTMKVNRWIAIKEQRGLREIETEVRVWQTEALQPRFELAKLALLDQHEAALELGRKLIASSDLSIEEWTTWPLLTGVRGYEATHSSPESIVTGDAGVERT